MKIFKKIAFLQIFALSWILFSCASTPKTEEKLPESEISGKEIPEHEASLQDENNNNSTELEISVPEDENGKEQNFLDLTEPLTEEQNPVLPELPELSQEAEDTESTEAPSSILEPQVKDVPDIEKDENQTQQNQDKEKDSAQNEMNLTFESNPAEQNLSEQTKIDGSSSENQNGENETDENLENANIIEETENSSKTDDTKQQEEIQKPSRSVTIKKNQNIDIVYPGKGWIYQGNIDENGNIDSRNRNFIFGGRKLGGKDTSFTLRSRNPGTYLLHFFKNDTLTGKYIDDFLEVNVQNETNTSDVHITVPDYAEIVPPKVSITAESTKIKEQKQNNIQETTQTEKTKDSVQKNEQKKSAEITENSVANSKNPEIDTIIQTTESAPENSSQGIEPENSTSSLENMGQDSLLELAKKYYSEKEYQQAFSAISKFFDKATERLDEGLFLQGQILEEKSPVQNIKSAIESYDLVVNNYPASPLWDKANKRSIFLKRFYINIR